MEQTVKRVVDTPDALGARTQCSSNDGQSDGYADCWKVMEPDCDQGFVDH